MGNIIIFSAHADDSAVGVMGTILKEIDKGNTVLEVIFSAGEMSHPHLKGEIVSRKRSNETLSVNKKIGMETLFLGLPDFNLGKSIDKKTKEDIKEIIESNNPEKIFVTSEHDLHKDHRAVFQTIMDALKYIESDCKVYTYEVWNIFKENKPSMYVDISDCFYKKVKYMKQYKSQWQSMYTLMLPVYVRAWIYGRKIKKKYAEKFYRIK
jgi:LmbE family N-acetylglucosaminyl deacetylase